MPDNSNISEWKRSWLSLWVVIHFFILAICLVCNNGSSLLFRRIHQLTAPYSIAFHQDYGAHPIEMTTGLPRSWTHRVEILTRDDTNNNEQWNLVELDNWPAIDLLDQRWRSFRHMLAVAATEDNEELVYVAFDQILQRLSAQDAPVDAVRLVRTATLSMAQDEQYRQGQLPAEELNDKVLYEARVVLMPGKRIRLLPVLERARRATSVEIAP